MMTKARAAGRATRAVGSLPATLKEIQRLFDAFDWSEFAQQVDQETRTRVAIVGPVNSGKSTLFNTLKGRELSPVSPLPGTTRDLHHEAWGPIHLADTPGFGEVAGVDRAGIALQAVRGANLVILVLDALAGVRQADYELLHTLCATGKPVIPVLNKIDVLGKDAEPVIEDARAKLNEPGLIPISALKGTHVADQLMPRLMEGDPALTVALGRALPGYRRQAAHRLIRQAAMLNALMGTEPIPGLDIPLLLAVQARLVLRIAAVYGEPMTQQHARELAATIAGGAALRYLAGQASKLIPGPGWVVSGAIAAAGTWAIGRTAMAYFESGKRLTPEQLRALYRRLVRRRRDEGPQDVHRSPASDA
jgi:small GTP-binding protein